ncbi:MAG: metallophosphoesterase [Myxococcota bacterium]
MFQGTPYFNFFRGRVELESMTRAGYDIATLGNHDFDLGASWLLTALKRYARFQICTSNLLFSHSGAQALLKPYVVRRVGGRRLGFFGLTVKLEGLVPANLWSGVKVLDPVKTAQKMVRELRHRHRCEAVICLSHLGNYSTRGEPGDQELARAVRGIDLIIGGHTHTFLDKAQQVRNAFQENTSIVQVGHSGVWLGQVDLMFGAQGEVHVQPQVMPIQMRKKSMMKR